MGRAIKKAVSVNELADALELAPLAEDTLISFVAPVTEAEAGTLCFAKNELWSQKVLPGAVALVAPEHAANCQGYALVSPSPDWTLLVH